MKESELKFLQRLIPREMQSPKPRKASDLQGFGFPEVSELKAALAESLK